MRTEDLVKMAEIVSKRAFCSNGTAIETARKIEQFLEQINEPGNQLTLRSSKDYKALYTLICNGKVVLAQVDYSLFDDDTPPSRDAVNVKRFKEYNISIWCRGHQYGGVDEIDCIEPELDAFVKECERLNLEWFG